ncbi:hypothetical protein P154DRAFT_528651 [Amniculicola lignicola CBS 123094]|uniref:Uncharacterized protein n=1 Tax=Amniculicola lignicola CBS 123094 TaxID=1392246 RepID=A0A6A5X5C0_9PLEO|nr:hypothetical protein P154DRAFT_528651 [Amniculicola lignicola CBS 123094]
MYARDTTSKRFGCGLKEFKGSSISAYASSQDTFNAVSSIEAPTCSTSCPKGPSTTSPSSTPAATARFTNFSGGCMNAPQLQSNGEAHSLAWSASGSVSLTSPQTEWGEERVSKWQSERRRLGDKVGNPSDGAGLRNPIDSPLLHCDTQMACSQDATQPFVMPAERSINEQSEKNQHCHINLRVLVCSRTASWLIEIRRVRLLPKWHIRGICLRSWQWFPRVVDFFHFWQMQGNTKLEGSHAERRYMLTGRVWSTESL